MKYKPVDPNYYPKTPMGKINYRPHTDYWIPRELVAKFREEDRKALRELAHQRE